MTRPLKAHHELELLMIGKVKDDPDPALIGQLGELDLFKIQRYPVLLHQAKGCSWSWEYLGTSPAIKAALERHGPSLQEQYDLA